MLNPRYHLQKDAEKGKYEKEIGIPIDKEKKTVIKLLLNKLLINFNMDEMNYSKKRRTTQNKSR